MPEKDKGAVVSGVISEALPNAQFRVRLDDGREVLAYLSGRMRLYRIKVMIGDRAELILDSYGQKGRIIKRL